MADITRRGGITRGKLAGGNPAFLRARIGKDAYGRGRGESWDKVGGGRNNYPVQIFVGAYGVSLSLSLSLSLSSAVSPPCSSPLPTSSPTLARAVPLLRARRSPSLSLPANWLGQDLHKNNLEQQSLEQLPPYLAGHRSPPGNATRGRCIILISRAVPFNNDTQHVERWVGGGGGREDSSEVIFRASAKRRCRCRCLSYPFGSFSGLSSEEEAKERAALRARARARVPQPPPSRDPASAIISVR
jgi:hypothetical protein